MRFDTLVYLCDYNYCQDKDHIHSLQKFPHALLFSPFHPFRQPLIYFLSLQISLLSLELYIVARVSNSFLLIAE